MNPQVGHGEVGGIDLGVDGFGVVSLLGGAQKATSSKLFMSHSTAQTAIVRISWRSCRRA